MERTKMGVCGILGLGFALAACGGDAADDRAVAGREGMQGREGMAGMEGMHMEPGAMQRHARELDELAAAMRPHLQGMRQLSPEEQHERMGEHVGHVSGMLGTVNRQIHEMDMGMGMTDEQMGQMMGMTGEQHRRMMDEMAALRAEVEALQTASPAELRQRMPAHLDRVERATGMVEESAEAMRGR